MNVQHLFRGDDQKLVAIGTGRIADLAHAVKHAAVLETLTAAKSKKGTPYATFELNPLAPRENLHLDVVYCGRVYKVTFPVVRIGDFVIVDDTDIVKVQDGALLHAFGVRENGQFVGFPRFHKKLSEVPSCVKCPFWVADQEGERGCVRLGGWQPAQLHHLNEAQCSADDRNRQGIKLVKVFDHYDMLPMNTFGEAIYATIREVKNATSVRTHEVVEMSNEERVSRVALRTALSAYVLEMDNRLAERGCEVPLFGMDEVTLRVFIDSCDSLTQAAQILNLTDGNLDPDLVLKARYDLDEELEVESIERLMEYNLI